VNRIELNENIMSGLGGLWVKTCLIFQKCPKKCPFWPLRVEVLNRDFKTSKNGVCYHYAHKTHFLM
jgi:hypothetical protein